MEFNITPASSFVKGDKAGIGKGENTGSFETENLGNEGIDGIVSTALEGVRIPPGADSSGKSVSLQRKTWIENKRVGP